MTWSMSITAPTVLRHSHLGLLSGCPLCKLRPELLMATTPKHRGQRRTSAESKSGESDRGVVSTIPHRIDVHHHIIPPRFIPEMGMSWVNRHNEPLPLHQPFQWTPAMSIEEMDKNGVATGMTSVSDPGVWNGDVDKSRAMMRYCNEYGADLVRDHKGRFGMFATLALPDVDGCLREIEYALDDLKADGFVLMTSYDNKWPGDAAFAPVLDELNRRKAVVYVHPTAPARCESLIPDVADAVVEFLFDTVRAVTSLLFSGTFSRCSDIKFIFSHAGSAVPLLAARIARLSRITPSVNARLPHGATHELKKLFYEIAQQASPEGLAPLMTLATVDRIMFGSDFPWAPPGMMAQTIAGLNAYGFKPSELQAIERGNALRLFPRFVTPTDQLNNSTRQSSH